MSNPTPPPFDPNQPGGTPNPYADQPPAYGAPVPPSPYGAVPPTAPRAAPPNPYGAPSPYATGPAAAGGKQPNSWRVFASFPMSAVAILFLPLFIGGASIVFAALAVQRKEKLG